MPYLLVRTFRKGSGQYSKTSQHLPTKGVEKAIVVSLNSLFDNPNFGSYMKDSNKDYYFIVVHTDSKISKEDLRKLEVDSGCKVELKNGLYGLVFFFTPRLEHDINPSER